MNHGCSITALALVACLSICAPVNAADRYVDASATQTGTGSSWQSPYKFLDQALAAANEGDVIFIAQGTYYPIIANPSDPEGATFQIADPGIRIQGGYLGGSTNPGQPGVRDINLYPTILSGYIAPDPVPEPDIDEGNCRHVITVYGLGLPEPEVPAARVIIEGVTVREGFADDQGNGLAPGFGGGAYIYESSVAFLRCKFMFNSAVVSGGGIMVWDEPGQGGGQDLFAVQVDVVDCLFIRCSALKGGAIANTEGTVSITNTIVRQNTATIENDGLVSQGAGVYNAPPGAGRAGHGVIELECCTFHLNEAENAASVRNENGGTLRADNCIFWDGANSLDPSAAGTLNTFRYCSSGEQITNSNDGNDTNNPLLNTDSTLPCNSPAINPGWSPYRPFDPFNLDNDFDNGQPVIGEPLPRDYTEGYRVIGPGMDRGAIEMQGNGECCYGNIDGNGVVNFSDLLEVINNWGQCPAPPAGCPADIDPSPCSDGEMNINDLLAVINNWGECDPNCPGEGGIASGIPQSYNDCSELCSEFTGQAWADCMQACFQILCERGQTQFCDD